MPELLRDHRNSIISIEINAFRKAYAIYANVLQGRTVRPNYTHRYLSHIEI
jgi:hypothetical protein